MSQSEPRLRAVAIIPARFDSSRFPGKPLAIIAGQTMIGRVVRRAHLAARLAEVIVATDDARIARAATEAGARVVMTSHDHRSGTDRVAAAAAEIEADVIVNIQGDQPLIDPLELDRLVEVLERDPGVGVATLVAPLTTDADWSRPDVVKVVRSGGRALYFSRAPIPYVVAAGGGRPVEAWKHIGVYAFRRAVLTQFAAWGASPLERAESLEQLRLLEHGVAIGVVDGFDSISVDRPDDVARVEQILTRELAM